MGVGVRDLRTAPVACQVAEPVGRLEQTCAFAVAPVS